MFSNLFSRKPQYTTAQPPPPASDIGGIGGGWRNDTRTGMTVGAASTRPGGELYSQQHVSAPDGITRPGGQSVVGGYRPTAWSSGRRQYTDVYAGVLFYMLLAFCIIGSIVTFARYERRYDTYTRKDFQWNTPTCTVGEYNQWKDIYNRLTPITPSAEPASRVESRLARDRGVRTALRAWVPVSLLVSIMLGLGFIAAYRKFASFMITFGLFFCLCWAIAFMVVNFVWGNWPLGLITIFIILAVIVAMFLCFTYRDVIATLFEVAGQGLGDNPVLILAVLVLFTVTFLLFVMFAFGIYYVLRFGSISKNPAVQNINRNNFNAAVQNQVCQSFDGRYVRCCKWETSPWAGVYGVFVIINFVWMLLVLFEMKLFIVGGVLCRWYTDSSEYWKGVRNQVLLDMIRYALMENFGSIALAGLLLWPLRLFRQFLNIFKACNLDCFCYDAMQRFTRFVPIYMAYTGDSFCTSAAMLSDQTNRFTFNLGAWWVPQMVLWSSSILIALGYAAIPYGITYSSYRQVSELLKADLLRLAWAVGWTSFALALVMLVFISTLMIDVINSVFICYILDTNNPSRPQRTDVHAIFNQITERLSQLGHNISYVGVGRVSDHPNPADTRPVDDRLNSSYPPQNYGAPGGYTVPPYQNTNMGMNNYNGTSTYPPAAPGGASGYPPAGYSMGPGYNRPPGYNDGYGNMRMSAPGGYPTAQGPGRPGSVAGGLGGYPGRQNYSTYPPINYPPQDYPPAGQPVPMSRPGTVGQGMGNFGAGPGGQYGAGGGLPMQMPGGAQVMTVENNTFRYELERVQAVPYAGGMGRPMGGAGVAPSVRMQAPGGGYNELASMRTGGVRPQGGEVPMFPAGRPGDMMPPPPGARY